VEGRTGGVLWVCRGAAAAAVVWWRRRRSGDVLLVDGVFVDLDGFLAVFCCTVGVPCFFGEDFEEAEVDGLGGGR
jgi:hypothetical protein